MMEAERGVEETPIKQIESFSLRKKPEPKCKKSAAKRA